MARQLWNFAGVTPAGQRAPYFPAGFHVGVITGVEDMKEKVKDGETPTGHPAAFLVKIGNHPTEGNPALAQYEASIRYSYGEKGAPFVMHLLCTLKGYTKEQLQGAGAIPFDPCAPMGQEGSLIGQKVYFEARPEARVDATDPKKKYDDTLLYTQAEWMEARAKAATAQQAAMAANNAAANIVGGPNAAQAQVQAQALAQQQAMAQQQALAAQQQALAAQQGGLPGMSAGLPGAQNGGAGGLPGMGGLPGVGGGLPGMGGGLAGLPR